VTQCLFHNRNGSLAITEALPYHWEVDFISSRLLRFLQIAGSAYRHIGVEMQQLAAAPDTRRSPLGKTLNSLSGYQQPNDASVVVVTSSTLKLRERAV